MFVSYNVYTIVNIQNTTNYIIPLVLILYNFYYKNFAYKKRDQSAFKTD